MARAKEHRDESLEPLLRAALVACGMPERYYTWCDGLPVRMAWDAGYVDYRPSREAQHEAWESTGLAFTRSGFVKARQPAGDLEITLSTIGSRSGPTFDVCPGIRRPDGGYTSDALHAICAELLQDRGEPLRDPAYPRPSLASDDQLRWLVDRMAELMADLAAYVEGQSQK